MELHQSTAMLTESALLLVCPHCNAGVDRGVVGLFWDGEESSWRCLLCGCRTFERPPRSRSQIIADEFWERLFPSSGEDASGQQQEEEEPAEALPPEAVA